MNAISPVPLTVQQPEWHLESGERDAAKLQGQPEAVLSVQFFTIFRSEVCFASQKCRAERCRQELGRGQAAAQSGERVSRSTAWPERGKRKSQGFSHHRMKSGRNTEKSNNEQGEGQEGEGKTE